MQTMVLACLESCFQAETASVLVIGAGTGTEFTSCCRNPHWQLAGEIHQQYGWRSRIKTDGTPAPPP